MTRRLLVVGFGPFPGVARNPSGTLAVRIAAARRWQRLDVAARALVLPTTYAALADDLAPALRSQPDAILMIGVAKRAKRIRVESRAVDAVGRFPDAAGRIPRASRLEPGGAAARTSSAAASVTASLRRLGLDARPSRDAGRYLCNASYYRALAGRCPVVFLHVPMPPRRAPRRRAPVREPGLERWARAFAQAACGLLARGRLQGVGTSCVRRSTESR